MAWKQIVPFDLSKMGAAPNMCLRNVRLAFGIPPKYVDAKAAKSIEKKLDEHNKYAEKLGSIEKSMVAMQKDIEYLRKGV